MSLQDVKVEERQDDGDTVYRYMPQTRRGGVWVRFGLEEFRIPPLGVREVRELEQDLAALQGIQQQAGSLTPEQWAAAHRIIWAALVRNYPTIEVKDVEPLADVSNLRPTLNALFGVSGFTRAEPGEDQPSR